MKIVLICILIINSAFSQEDAHLFRVYSGNKAGYIDSAGKIIIQPEFIEAQDFSEGLAAARLKGKYGFINKSGSFVIPPKYDYATEFRGGTALVFVDGTPILLSPDGKEIRFENYQTITFFDTHKANVLTHSGKAGVIDSKGNLIIDTIYRFISFKNRMGIAGGLDKFKPDKNGGEHYSESVIDTLGNVIIPLGKYTGIYGFDRGCFRVEYYLEETDSYYTGFLDETGNMIISRPGNNLSNDQLSNNVNDTSFIISYFDFEGAKGQTSSEYNYQCIVNSKGEVIAKDLNWKYITPLNENLCSVMLKDNRKNILIDAKGTLVLNDTLDCCIEKLKGDSLFLIKKDDKFGMLNMNHEFVVPLQKKSIEYPTSVKDYFVFGEYANQNYSWGLADSKGKTIIKPGHYQFPEANFKNGLISVNENGNVIYFNQSGMKIWGNDVNDEITLLNIDYMRRDGFIANYNDKANGRKNFFKTIKQNDVSPNQALTLFINDQDTVVYEKNFKGLKLFLMNNTNQNLNIQTQDNRLYIKFQAKDTEGKWKDIEWLSNSFCGNSYYDITIDKNKYCSFIFPVYDGDLKTDVRAELEYRDPDDKTKIIRVYSNPIKCGINPGQFWRKKDWFRDGIMYNY